jgi:hypothetical protein
LNQDCSMFPVFMRPGTFGRMPKLAVCSQPLLSRSSPPPSTLNQLRAFATFAHLR